MVRRLISAFGIFACILTLAVLCGGATAAPAQGAPVRTDALVLVNTQSDAFGDFATFVRPYLENFGLPYTVLDVSATDLPATVGQYSLVIVGHRRLDAGLLYLDMAEQDLLAAAVEGGSGLVTFDNDLWDDEGLSRYSFVKSIFGFDRNGSTSGSGVQFSVSGVSHYIAARHAADETIATGTMRLADITLTSPAEAVAVSGDQPLVAVTDYGSGRAVQWGSYDWMSHSVLGPVHGLDDLVWRGFVWAARKPFVMQALPPIVTMRVDDVNGPFDYVPAANDVGFKPWVGLFIDQVYPSSALKLSALTNAGQASASVHGFNNASTPYFDLSLHRDYPDDTVTANLARCVQWHEVNEIPISPILLTHFYDFGTNVFGGLQDWGVEFVGTLTPPGVEYGHDWLTGGPYRLSETLKSNAKLPVYYADFLAVPGHPELDGMFFNCMTEIRDENGYEWYPTNDVEATVGHGVRQLRRALDSRVLSTLFAHEPGINDITTDNWRTILDGVSEGIAGYQPLQMTMDDACRYVRGLHTSGISAAGYDPGTGAAATILTGTTDVPTQFSLFVESGGEIEELAVLVPAFAGSTEVVVPLGADTGDVTPPAISAVTLGPVSDSDTSVTWTTDEAATTQVQYGTSAAYGSATPLDTSMLTEHARAITGLLPDTLYHYRVVSIDAAGNVGASEDGTFTTGAPVRALAVGDLAVTEGNEGLITTFSVILSAASSLPVTVSYATADAGAVAGLDYTPASGVLTFTPGQTTKHVSVTVLADVVDEDDETFTLDLSDAGNAVIANGQGVCTIHDLPDVATDDVSVAEGGETGSTATFTVSLSTASGFPVTVDYATSDGSALAGVHYTAVAGTLTFAPGETTKTIDVPILGDTVDEDDAAFALDLSGATNAAITDGQGVCAILDDDASPGITIDDVSVAEGDAGSVSPTFTVSLSEPSSLPVTVAWATSDGTALAGLDYTVADDTISFAPGETTKTLSVEVLGDFLHEVDEDFTIDLSDAVDAVITDGQGLGTILDDDPAPSLGIDDVSVTEGDVGSASASFTVNLSAASSLPVTVDYATMDGSASAGADYTAANDTLTFAPGETTKTVTVIVDSDLLDEADEQFTVGLSEAVNAPLSDDQGVCTILDDDAAPGLTIDDVRVNEGDSGTGRTATFTVRLSAVSGLPVTVDYATVWRYSRKRSRGTAIPGVDYIAVSGTLTFSPGVLTQTIAVKIKGDRSIEPDETFLVLLSNPQNAALTKSEGIGTIADDD